MDAVGAVARANGNPGRLRAAVAPKPTATPEPATAPKAAQATCDDSAIRLLDRAAGVHGAIVADTLHLGGAIAPATCTDPTNESWQGGLPLPNDRAAQVQQSEYYLLVIRYTDGNRLYVISHRGDGTACVVDTNDECVAQVTDLPDDFDLDGLPDDVARTLPAGRPAAPTVSPAPGGDDTPPEPSPPSGGDDTPPGASSPPAATGPLGVASNPQPRDGATGVTVNAPLLSWAAAPGAAHYYVHWDIRTPSHAGVKTTSTFLRMSARDSDLVDGYGVTGRLDGETTYYWYVEAVTAGTVGCPSDSSCNRSRMWSFTTGPAPSAETPPDSGGGTPPTAPAPSPGSPGDGTSIPEAPSWGDDATEAVKAFLGISAHATTTVTIPTPAGNPVPQVRIKIPFPGSRYELGLSNNGFRLSLDPLSLTLEPDGTEAVRKIVLVATNSEGSAEMEVRSTATCGYSQTSVISLWLGTHPLSPASSVGSFEGQTSVTVTSTGFVVGGVTSSFWTQDRARTRVWGGGPGPAICGVLVASADDGRVYVLDRMMADTNTLTGVVGGHILANLPGSTTPACTNKSSDARIFSYYPRGTFPRDHENYGYSHTALINHKDC